MNRDWEEEKIRQLFHKLRQEDEQLASPFIRDWEAARSRAGARPRFFPFNAAATTTAILILLSAFSLILLKPSLQPAAPPSPWESTSSILLWQAPTDFLLRTPGSELVKAVPEIGRSSVQIHAVVLEEKSR